MCSAGTCAAQCFIDGAVVAANGRNPANKCQKCDPAVSTTAWSAGAAYDLFVGGVDAATQGWSKTSRLPNALALGADYTEISTSTTGGALTSGQQLLYLPQRAADERGLHDRRDAPRQRGQHAQLGR